MRRQALIAALTNVAIAVLGFATSAMLSRWLGAEGRGEFAAVLLWPTLLTFLVSLGVSDSLVYFVAGNRAAPEVLLGSLLALAAAQSLVAIPIGYTLVPLLMSGFGDDAIRLGRAYLFITPVALVTQYLMSVLQGQHRLLAFNALRLVIPVFYAVSIAALRVAGGIEVGGIVTTLIVLNVLLLPLVAVVYLRGTARPVVVFDGWQTRELVSYGLKTHGAGIAGQLNLRLDQPVVALLLSPAQLGLYVAAVSAANITQLLPQAVRLVATPSVARIGSAPDRVTALRASFSAYWTLSLIAAAAMAIILPFAIPLVFGREFSDMTMAAEILLAASLLLGAKTVLAGGAQALGDPWLASRGELLALPVSVAFLLLLVPWLGIEGAAVASLLAYGAALAFILRDLKTRHGVPPRDLFRIDGRSSGLLARHLVEDARSAFRSIARRRA